MDVLEVVLVVAFVGCFVGAAILSAAEVSIIRVRRSEILVTAKAGGSRSQKLLGIIDELPVVLNTVLLLVLLFQVAAATIGGYLAARWFGGIGVTVVTVLLTAVLFVYAEAVPKTRAVASPRATAMRLTPMLQFLARVLRPVVAGLVRLVGFHTDAKSANVGALSEEELKVLADESAEAGRIAEGDATLLARSFEFNDRCVGDVMVPRQQIVAIAGDRSVLDALGVAISAGHRRLPVYGQDLDDVLGIIRLRDLAAVAQARPQAITRSCVSAVLRSRSDDLISELLSRMQLSGRWLAIVTDLEGRTVGLATIEDIVAELVGEIADERGAPGQGGHFGP